MQKKNEDAHARDGIKLKNLKNSRQLRNSPPTRCPDYCLFLNRHVDIEQGCGSGAFWRVYLAPPDEDAGCFARRTISRTSVSRACESKTPPSLIVYFTHFSLNAF